MVVGAKVAGRVGHVLVDLGDLVHGTSPLVTLDREEFLLQVSQAEAQLLQARAAVGLKEGDPVSKLDPTNAPPVREQRATWDEAKTKSVRIRQLALQNAVTEVEVEQVIAAEKVAEARYSAALNSVNEKIALIGVRTVELAQAKQRLQDSEVQAPFEGLVQERHVAPGSYVQVGQALVSMVRTNPLRFQGTVPERFAQRLSLGQEVWLEVQTVPGLRKVKLSRLSPALDDASRSLLFEAVVDNSDGRLRAGLFASGQVLLDPQSTSLVVPEATVMEFAGTEKVWKVVDGKSVEQIVTTGERREGMVEVLNGLVQGDVVLADAAAGKLARVTPVFPPVASAEDPALPPSRSEPVADSNSSREEPGTDETDENEAGGP